MGRENSKIGEKERLKREKVMVAVLAIILATLEIFFWPKKCLTKEVYLTITVF